MSINFISPISPFSFNFGISIVNYFNISKIFNFSTLRHLIRYRNLVDPSAIPLFSRLSRFSRVTLTPLLDTDNGTAQKVSKSRLSNTRSTLCFYFYRIKCYVYNSMSFASEGKLITYSAINLTLVLQPHWLVSSCFVTLQVGRSFALANSGIPCVKVTFIISSKWHAKIPFEILNGLSSEVCISWVVPVNGKQRQHVVPRTSSIGDSSCMDNFSINVIERHAMPRHATRNLLGREWERGWNRQ